MADTLDGLELLRQEVPEHLVGKLPKVTCYACRQKENRGECKEHRKRKCDECGGWLTPAHMHLDYVGHAETTAQLLEADIEWNWEPVALDANGLPAFDADGGLWIKLTVCGVTRLGYGTADNANGFKARGDIRKEIIGDALRNAAMRFGWALNLWAKTDIHEHAPQEEPESHPAQRSNGTAPESDPWTTPTSAAEAPKANKALLKTVNIEVTKRVGNKDEDRLGLIADIVGRPITSSGELTVAEARGVLAALAKADEQNAQAAGPPEGWTPEQSDHLAADFLSELQGARTDAERVEIGQRIGAAVKARKLTAADRETLLAAYTGRQPQPAGAPA